MKKKIFSAICLLLSAVCIFSACRKDNGNGGSDEQTGSAASGDSTASSANDLILPYSNNDSLNPFFCRRHGKYKPYGFSLRPAF